MMVSCVYGGLELTTIALCLQKMKMWIARYVSTSVNVAVPCDVMLLYPFMQPSSEGEYALNYSVDVAFWLDFRASHQQSPLKEVGDYFIINSSLHDEFDSFKEKYTYRSHSFIRQVELLQLYSKESVHKFGNKYLMLSPSEV